MRKTLKFLIASGACLVMAGTGQMSAQAAMNLETDAPVAGASVAINNYYASSLNPEKELAEAFASKEVLAVAGAGQTGVAGGARRQPNRHRWQQRRKPSQRRQLARLRRLSARCPSRSTIISRFPV